MRKDGQGTPVLLSHEIRGDGGGTGKGGPDKRREPWWRTNRLVLAALVAIAVVALGAGLALAQSFRMVADLERQTDALADQNAALSMSLTKTARELGDLGARLATVEREGQAQRLGAIESELETLARLVGELDAEDRRIRQEFQAALEGAVRDLSEAIASGDLGNLSLIQALQRDVNSLRLTLLGLL